ncbi:hypothetical protein VPH35_129627 [Triticum aestivum]
MHAAIHIFIFSTSMLLFCVTRCPKHCRLSSGQGYSYRCIKSPFFPLMLYCRVQGFPRSGQCSVKLLYAPEESGLVLKIKCIDHVICFLISSLKRSSIVEYVFYATLL